MHGMHNTAIPPIQNLCIEIRQDLPVSNLECSFEKLLNWPNQCSKSKWDNFEKDRLVLPSLHLLHLF